MNKNLKYEMTTLIRRFNNINAGMKSFLYTKDRERDGIRVDKVHSDLWKNEQYKKIDADQDRYIREHSNTIKSLFERILDCRDEMENNFDFTDSELQTALNTVKLMGKNMPYPVRTQIIERFKGNPTALDMLRPFYDEYGFNVDKIKEYKMPFDMVQKENDYSALAEFWGRSASVGAAASWQDRSAVHVLSSYTKAFGLDTSVNPYLAEIEAKYKETNSPKIRLFLSQYKTALESDSPKAVEAAKNALENGF